MSIREKHVYDTSEIAHLWASGNKDWAKNPAGNFSFRGNELLSYSTCIARIVEHAGQRIALLGSRSWSRTTSRHQYLAHRAISHLPCYKVPSWENEPDHAINISHYRSAIEQAFIASYRARSHAESRLNDAKYLVVTGNQYARDFNLSDRFEDIFADQAALIAVNIRKAKDNENKAAKSRRENAERAAEMKRLKSIERLPLWLAGQNKGMNVQGPFDLWQIFNHLGSTDYLRIDPDNSEQAQTSQGVHVPLSHVKRALRFVLPYFTSGSTYIHEDHSISLGEFRLDNIDINGRVRVGCHSFSRCEVERFAQSIGLLTPQSV